ncbi:hypothetical protein GPJ56_001561 [Histomonas meleagridis]|uniref:uncharacterized protein n=1 Tax=Histomonas meleagridis TaxID=135588 RepID=UPI003559DAAA|nr:hypothetical protein GPJ56_001561 [Histomonas meleagridis]KAH0807067.1 hypothetical protein GO595_000243 [Histomonas meleagridis]
MNYKSGLKSKESSHIFQDRTKQIGPEEEEDFTDEDMTMEEKNQIIGQALENAPIHCQHFNEALVSASTEIKNIMIEITCDVKILKSKIYPILQTYSILQNLSSLIVTEGILETVLSRAMILIYRIILFVPQTTEFFYNLIPIDFLLQTGFTIGRYIRKSFLSIHIINKFYTSNIKNFSETFHSLFEHTIQRVADCQLQVDNGWVEPDSPPIPPIPYKSCFKNEYHKATLILIRNLTTRPLPEDDYNSVMSIIVQYINRQEPNDDYNDDFISLVFQIIKNMLLTKTLSFDDLESSGLTQKLLYEFYEGSYVTRLYACDAFSVMVENGWFNGIEIDMILTHIDEDANKDKLTASALHLLNTIIEYVPPNILDVVSELTDFSETNQGFKTIAKCGNGEYPFRVREEAAKCFINLMKRANLNQLNVMIIDEENAKITFTALLSFSELEDAELVNDVLFGILKLFEESEKSGEQRVRDLWYWFSELNGSDIMEDVQELNKDNMDIQEKIEKIQTIWEDIC